MMTMAKMVIRMMIKMMMNNLIIIFEILLKMIKYKHLLSKKRTNIYYNKKIIY